MVDLFRDIFIKRWQYKLAAFLTAVALWFYVVREQNLGVMLNIPVELVNPPANMKITNKFKNAVDLSLEGRREIITKINKQDIKVQIDLIEAKEGKNIYIITSKRITGIPRGLDIRNISPSRIVFVFASESKPSGDNKESSDKHNGKTMR